jgi:hypothetical protein
MSGSQSRLSSQPGAIPRAGVLVGAISEVVGHPSAKVLTDRYKHVLMDEREVDYASVIAERLGTAAESVLA